MISLDSLDGRQSRERTENGVHDVIGGLQGRRKVVGKRDFEVFELLHQSLRTR